MTLRNRLLFGLGVLALPLLFAPLLLQPIYAIALVAIAALFALAYRSVAYPVALAGLPAVAIGLSGGNNPLPQGIVTKFLALWLLVGIVFSIARHDDELPLRVLLTPPVIVTMLLVAWMVARLGASLDPSYGSRKLQLFVSDNVLALFGGILIARRRARFELYVFVALVMAVLSSLAIARGLLSGTAHQSVGGRFALTADDSPIGLGRDAARGILLAVFVLLASRKSWFRIVAFCALPLVTVALIASGSRGPVVGLVVGLATLLVLSARERAARARMLFVVAGAALAVVLVPQLVPGHDVGRALSIFSGRSQGLSSNGRSHLWHDAWQLFTLHPLTGIGTGSFGFFQPVELFPHNILLETGAELGILGLGLTAAFIAAGAWLVWRVWRSTDHDVDRGHATVVLALFVSATVNAMLSSDISTNSSLWLAGGLALGLSRRLDLVLPSVVAIRGLQRAPRRHGAPTPVRARRGAPSALPAVSPPRILAPSAGASVGGVVQVDVAPGRGASPMALMRLVWSVDGVDHVVAEHDERTFEVRGGSALAVVRSRWLAELIATALGTDAQPSRRRPWTSASTVTLWWDAATVAPGRGALRAIRVDEQRREAESDPVELAVTAAPPSDVAPPEQERLQALTRLADTRRNVAQLEAEARRRVEEAEARAAAVEAEAAELAQERRRLEVAGRDLAVRRRELADLDARATALAAEREALDARAAEVTGLEQRAAELDVRAAAVAGLEEERAALAAREAEVADLEARASAVAAERAELDRRRMELEERAVEVTELERRAAELDAARAALDERSTALAAEHAELDRRTIELDERASEVSGLERRAAELDAERVDVDARIAELADLEQRAAALETIRAAVDERVAALEASRAELDVRAAEVADVEERAAALDAERRELERRAADVTGRAEQLAILEQRARELEEERNALDVRAADFEKRAAALEAERAAVDERLARVADLEERAAALDARAAELADLEQRAAALEADRAEVERRTLALADADRRATEIAAEQRALDARRTELGDLEARATDLARAQDELARREAEVAARSDELRAELAAVAKDRSELERRTRAIDEARAEVQRREAAVEAREREAAAALERARRKPSVSLTLPAKILREAVELAIAARDVDEAPRVEVAAGSEWRPVAVENGTLDTRSLPDGPARLRAAADDAVSEPVVVVVDNTPPQVAIVRPAEGDVLAGVVVPEVEATDEASGVDSVLVQRSRDGASWRPLPHGSWDTEHDEDGLWMLRATAVDGARNVGRSEIVNVLVRNAVPAPEPEPVAAPAAHAAPRTAAFGRPTLFELEAAADAVADPMRREELEAILFFLRDYADVDGLLPAQFDGLVDQEFGL